MKKLLLSIVFVGMLVPWMVGQVPNGDFDDWTSGGSYEDPDGWATPNALLAGTAEIVTKITNAHSLPYAAELTSTSIVIITVPGLMGTGTINSTTYTFEGGFPQSNSPATFGSWYKYSPAGGDSCLFAALLTKYNGATTDTIAVAAFITGTATANWTEFSVPFNYLNPPNYAVDTAQIIILSSFNAGNAQAGSTLDVDDVVFAGTVGVENVNAPSGVSLYPNPAKDKFVVKLGSIQNADRVIIFDVLGNKVKTVEVESPSSVNVNIESLANGFYFYRVQDKTGNPLVNGKFSVKH